MSLSEDRIDRDVLSLPLRVGEIVMVIGMLLLFGFFVYHQTNNTGFFTEKFGTLEMLCLYGPLLFGLTAPAVRAWAGSRQPARPYEAATSLLLTLGSLWLLIAFPFNYAHLADALPAGLQFLLRWVTDDIAKFVLLLQVVIGPISAVLTLWRYAAKRQRAYESSLKRRPL